MSDEIKAFHMTFRYAVKQPGIITLTGKDKEEAIDKLKKMAEGFDFLDIIEVIDYNDIPGLLKMKEEQERNAKEQQQEAPADNDNEEKVIN